MPHGHTAFRRTAWPTWAACLASIALAGCASTPRLADSSGPAERPAERPAAPPARAEAPSPALPDRPPEPAPADLAQVPDSEPRVEPVRAGGPNKPYAVQGETFEPLRGDPEIVERGIASWYGRPFHGRRTASGEVYDMFAMTAAHKTMPIPSYALVVNPANGREVVVRINDRGPFIKGRIIDLSYTAAIKLGVTRSPAPVEVSRITHQAIRTGLWKRADTSTVMAAAAPPQASPALSGSAMAPPPAEDPAPAAATSLPSVVAMAPEPAPSSGRPGRAPTSAARGFWVQLGAFARHDGAVDFQRRVEQELASLAPLLAVFAEQSLHRLQAGPFASRGEAQGTADAVRAALKLVPVIVERR